MAGPLVDLDAPLRPEKSGVKRHCVRVQRDIEGLKPTVLRKQFQPVPVMHRRSPFLPAAMSRQCLVCGIRLPAELAQLQLPLCSVPFRAMRVQRSADHNAAFANCFQKEPLRLSKANFSMSKLAFIAMWLGSYSWICTKIKAAPG